MSHHTLSAEPCHSRWNRALAPRLRIAPGDTVHLSCRDSSDGQVHIAAEISKGILPSRKIFERSVDFSTASPI